MTEILSHYEPITLEQMKDIRLMNRIDTKFVTTEPMLRRLLVMACDDYFVQETDGLRISPYYTLYFDTPDCAMYNRHQVGHLSRQKIRIRSYVKAGLNFLEVKTKNNHGRTKKKRIAMEQFDALHPQELDCVKSDRLLALQIGENYRYRQFAWNDARSMEKVVQELGLSVSVPKALDQTFWMPLKWILLSIVRHQASLLVSRFRKVFTRMYSSASSLDRVKSTVRQVRLRKSMYLATSRRSVRYRTGDSSRFSSA